MAEVEGKPLSYSHCGQCLIRYIWRYLRRPPMQVLIALLQLGLTCRRGRGRLPYSSSSLWLLLVVPAGMLRGRPQGQQEQQPERLLLRICRLAGNGQTLCLAALPE